MSAAPPGGRPRGLLLALETATPEASLALLDGEEVVAEAALDPGPRHASGLLPALDRLLRERGLGPEAIGDVALSIGPGSFTGLRVGLASALGLCFASDRRIVPVPTLAALSLAAGGAARAAPLLDARRGQVYAGLYLPGGEALAADRVATPQEVAAALRGAGPVWLLGSGARRHRRVLAAALGDEARWLPEDCDRPRAAAVGRLGARGLAAGRGREPAEVELRYLRRPEAEVRRVQKVAGHPGPEPIT